MLPRDIMFCSSLEFRRLDVKSLRRRRDFDPCWQRCRHWIGDRQPGLPRFVYLRKSIEEAGSGKRDRGEAPRKTATPFLRQRRGVPRARPQMGASCQALACRHQGCQGSQTHGCPPLHRARFWSPNLQLENSASITICELVANSVNAGFTGAGRVKHSGWCKVRVLGRCGFPRHRIWSEPPVRNLIAGK